ncbi:acyl carrier protein [Sphingosinicella sp.]|uniref:acyl carrier protein n=1 Tax=Sphingosinicella sp. TaxID=1917971 RepID=UPI0040383ADE
MVIVSSGSSSFPEDKVIAAIKTCWIAETAKGTPEKPTADKPGSIMDPLIEIDSHGVVRCFVSIEKETGIAIPETEAKDTGYDSLNDLIANVVPLAKKYFEKNLKKDADADSDA